MLAVDFCFTYQDLSHTSDILLLCHILAPISSVGSDEKANCSEFLTGLTMLAFCYCCLKLLISNKSKN